MRNAFIVISCILTTASVVPYILNIIKRKTKPRVVSWFTWMVLAAIASTASLLDGQYPAAIFSFFSTLQVAAVFILGFYYYGERSISRFDIACQLAAVMGLVLWYIFNSPATAIVAVIIIDLIASLPTLKHSWQKPSEETWETFFISGTGALFVIMAVTDYKITSVANPVYLVFINYLITGVLLYRLTINKQRASQKTNS